MAQKKLKGKSRSKSVGALRKYVGESKKKTVHNKRQKTVVAKARANYVSAVETHMTSRLPSDQRGRLTILKTTGTDAQQQTKKKNMKKPLTRGRKRKAAKKE